MPKADPDDRAPIAYAVLCSAGDASAVWVAGELAARGLPVRVVTTEELVYSPDLTHTVASDGRATSVRIRLVDGSVLGPGLRGTLNRVLGLPTAHLAATTGPDREYVVAELQAVLTSVLAALPGVVVGRADPRGFGGAWWRAAEWAVAAGGAGLPGTGWRSGGEDPAVAPQRVLVVAGHVVAAPGLDVPPAVRDGLVALGAAHGGGLIGVDLETAAGRWAFRSATPWPDLRPFGAGVVDVLDAALRSTVVAPEGVPA